MNALATAGACRVSWKIATFIFHTCKKIWRKNKYKRKTKLVYEHVLVGVATTMEEVGISDYMAYILSIEEIYDMPYHRGRPETASVNSVSRYCCKQFQNSNFDAT
jgi:hypothetical protein